MSSSSSSPNPFFLIQPLSGVYPFSRQLRCRFSLLLSPRLRRHPMPLSKRHLSENSQSVRFDPEALGAVIREKMPHISFLLLMGSSVRGVVAEGSDLDLALFLDGKPDLDFYQVFPDLVNSVVPGVRVDFGLLNGAEPVYRFEALKGRLLFVRDPEVYQDFFSRTCREYEECMRHYENQLRYRREAAHAG